MTYWKRCEVYFPTALKPRKALSKVCVNIAQKAGLFTAEVTGD